MAEQVHAAPPIAMRIRSVDLLRGLVIILMALDHVRDFWGPTPAMPEDMEAPSLALFLTRWITHFCAPVFIFLSGTSAFLFAHNTHADQRTLSYFLATRGVWLIVIELVIVNFSWTLFMAGFMFVQVLWAIGWSMLFLALLIHLPLRAIAAIGLVMVFAHNMLDGISAQSLGSWAIPWAVLHEQYFFQLDGFWFGIMYPLIPWVGVMALGYVFGQVLVASGDQWRRAAVHTGLAAIGLFLILRLFNLYGDPNPWTMQEGFTQTLISFLNTEKYPPSLLFLLMTLGPVLLLMPYFENLHGKVTEWIGVFGRVPFFFYVLHVPVIHLGAIIWAQFMYGRIGWWMQGPDAYPAEYEQNLWLVWGVWLAVVALLFPVCRWYARLKRRRDDWWLKYL